MNGIHLSQPRHHTPLYQIEECLQEVRKNTEHQYKIDALAYICSL